MEQNSKYIIATMLSVGLLSCIYFLSLLLPVPFMVSILVILVSIFFLFKFIITTKTAAGQSAEQQLPWQAVLGFGLCAALLVKNALGVAEKHGGWDAWAIWNFHAGYLSEPVYWKNLFRNIESDHPDYPLCLPSVIGFFYRLCAHHFTIIIPFAFSMLVTVSIPALLFSEFIRKNMVVALFITFLFAQDKVFLGFGVAEYADSLLALFLLGAFVCIDHAIENKRYLLLSAACLGGCIWTKNEGAILAGLFLLFNARIFFQLKNIRYTIGGLALPVITLVIFKMNAHVQNDMVNSLNKETINLILDIERYKTIWHSFTDNLNQKFYYVKIGVYIYLILLLIEKKWPDWQMLLVFTCLLVYNLIYVVTTHGLEWHLQTSQDRLMHQLMPAMVYILAKKLAGIRVSYPLEQA